MDSLSDFTGAAKMAGWLHRHHGVDLWGLASDAEKFSQR